MIFTVPRARQSIMALSLLFAPWLVQAQEVLPTEKLSPRIRIQEEKMAAEKTVLLPPFLMRAWMLDPTQAAMAPRIVGAPEGRVHAGQGDEVYVQGVLPDAEEFEVFRTHQLLQDAKAQEVFGLEVASIGLARLKSSAQDVHIFSAEVSQEELSVGDILLPKRKELPLSYRPHFPEKWIEGQVISLEAGVGHAGQGQMIVLNRGSQDGLTVGAILYVGRKARLERGLQIPWTENGEVHVFRVFDRVAFAHTVKVKDSVRMGDAVFGGPRDQ